VFYARAEARPRRNATAATAVDSPTPWEARWWEGGRQGSAIGTPGHRGFVGTTARPLPGTVVVTASDVDAHNHVVRYAWKIVDQEGHTVMEGTDIAERSNDGRRRRLAAVLVVGGDGV
jgi:hypothetical protein